LATRPGPLRFAEDGSAKLSGWRFKSDNSEMAQGNRIVLAGREMLRLRGTIGDGAGGSWRTIVQLQPGHYEFTGQARTRGEADPRRSASGVLLRTSGDSNTDGITLSDDWKTITYAFDVRGLESIELVCEFRGPPGGVGEFDATTLRLIRKSPEKISK